MITGRPVRYVHCDQRKGRFTLEEAALIAGRSYWAVASAVRRGSRVGARGMRFYWADERHPEIKNLVDSGVATEFDWDKEFHGFSLPALDHLRIEAGSCKELHYMLFIDGEGAEVLVTDDDDVEPKTLCKATIEIVTTWINLAMPFGPVNMSAN